MFENQNLDTMEGDAKKKRPPQRPFFSSKNSAHMPHRGPAVGLTGPTVLARHYLNHDDMQSTAIQLKSAAAAAYLDRHPETDSTLNFSIDYEDLLRDDMLSKSWPSIGHDLQGGAGLVVGIFGLAKLKSSKTLACVPRGRIVNHGRVEGTLSVEQLRASDVGKLISVTGTVIRVSPVQQTCTWMTFTCLRCDTESSVQQAPSGKFTQPSGCIKAGCRSHSFSPIKSSPHTLSSDTQCIRLQDTSSGGGGRVPRLVDCTLSNDLCDNVAPGDVVTVTAVVQVSEQDGLSSNQFSIYLEALSLTASASHAASQGGQLTLLDYSAIQEIFSLGPELFKLLVASLCPSIYGQPLVKAGLLLSLFGGAAKSTGGQIPVRADPHVLMVGDPGLGKSQLLRSCANVAPRSVLVTATGATATGLTVTMTKESGNEFALEAGALVLADQGCCCIDEFDKMGAHHPALLEAMEQQSISLAKSGVVCSLPAKTAILAAANPSGGHYNRAKTVAENLRLNPALLSRFDLVFILIDKPNEELDSLLSDHIMGLHGGGSSTSRLGSSTASLTSSNTLSNRLLTKPGEQVDHLPHDLMKKYIAYARRYVFPKLSAEAAQVIQRFYLQLRENHHSSDATPITTRQLESLIRLTEARAKVELREEATGTDAKEVIEIMRSSMLDTFTDELGTLDFSRAPNGSGMSKAAKARNFVAALQKFAATNHKNTFTVDEMKGVLQRSGIKVPNFYDFLGGLNNQGFLLKQSAKVYQLLTVD